MDVYPSTSAVQPLAFQDASSEDTFASLASTLQHMLATADEVFGRIEARVGQERGRLHALNVRIARVREKINAVGTSTKAVTLYAQPKYPAAEVARHADFFTLHDGMSYPAGQSTINDDLAPVGARRLEKESLQPDDEVLTRPDKREQVTDLLARVSLRSRPDRQARAGLGRLPAYLPSVSSTLLWNTRQRPYVEQQTLDELITAADERALEVAGLGDDGDDVLSSRAGKVAGRRSDKPKRTLGAAPVTLSEGDALPALAAVEYGYKPKMRDLAALALPSSLALPNVADMSWQANVASIAPTVAHAAVAQLPTELDLLPPPPPPPPMSMVSTAMPALPPVGMNAALPTLPALPTVPVQAATAPALPPMPQSMPAAPRPPAPPAAPAMEHDVPRQPAAAQAAPPRNDLLAALSNPENMRKLKKAATKEEESAGSSASKSGASEESSTSKKGSSGGGVSMMDEMANRLALRRKAMAGQGDGSDKKKDVPPSPAKPVGASVSGSSSSTTTAAPESGSGGMFRPESMHGFKLSTTKAKAKTKKRGDSDDWGTESEDD